jgi:hypothetical protein
LKGDTVQCYTIEELKIIASRVVDASECDTLLALSNLEIIYKDSLIISKEKQAWNFKQEATLNKTMLDDTMVIVEDLQEALKLEVRAHKRTRIKFGIIGTAMLLGGGYLITR